MGFFFLRVTERFTASDHHTTAKSNYASALGQKVTGMYLLARAQFMVLSNMKAALCMIYIQ